MKYLIDGLLPENQIHLIGGPSGSGKTTLMFQMQQSLTTGVQFLGRKVNRTVRWAYVSGDRTAESVGETQARCGVAFPVFSLVDENLIGEDLCGKIIPRLTHVYGYRPDFVYVDGFTSLVPEGKFNDYKTVARWLGGIQRYCKMKKIVVMGACHTTKTKEGEKFLNPRQRIAGSVAWAGFSETVMIIEPPDDHREDHLRVLSLLPRNQASEHIRLRFNQGGILVMDESEERRDMAADFILSEMLVPGGSIEYQVLLSAAGAKGVSRTSLDRWLRGLVESGGLVREKKGVYNVTVDTISSKGIN